MSRTQTWRIGITLLMVLAALYYSWPTIKFWTISEQEKQQLAEDNPARLFTMKQEAIRLGLDLQGGMHVVLRVAKEKLDKEAADDAVERAEQIIRNRIDQFGVTEPLIQTSGDDRIIVDLPGFTDVERAQKLIGEHDFASFASSGRKRMTTVRTLLRCQVWKKFHWLYFDLEATGFLYHMVRNIVGTLLEVGRGHRQPEDIENVLAAGNRSAAGRMAPANGLCLQWVKY